MSTPQADVERVIRAFLARTNKPSGEWTADTPLYADGIGLDSLETAELSAVLEDEFGTDPFSSGEMPQTMGEIYAYYATVAADA
jgi:acyl carrier protein